MKMIPFLLAAVLILGAADLFAQTAKKPSKVTGTIVDVPGYVMSGLKADTPDAKAVIEARLKTGAPYGIVERSTGRLYLIVLADATTTLNDKVLPYLGMKVFVVGKVYRRGELRVIELTDIGQSNQ
jgi:hypothetical protein